MASSRTLKTRRPSRAAKTGPSTQPAPPNEAAYGFEIGETVSGNYEIRGLLGEGGMGSVYEAHDRALNRRVAIKISRPDAAPTFLRAEARALAAIRHPCMAVVHSFGKHRDIEYLVMERVLGTSLRQHVDQRRRLGQPFSIADAVDILIALADGLAVVHRAGVAHRDIKPSNIMIAPRNRVVLLDFGLFRAEYDAESGDPVGSPEYMAPEVISDRLEPGAGARADIYALGIVAFEILTGTVPYEANSTHEILERHLHAPIPDLCMLRTDVPPALGALVREMLAKSPSDRPQSAEDVLWQLQSIRTQVAHAQAAPSVRVGTARGSANEKPNVLVVHGDPDVAERVAHAIRRTWPHAQIGMLDTADEAVQVVRARPPQIVVAAAEMPGMSGVDLALYLRGARVGDRCKFVFVGPSRAAVERQVLEELGGAAFVATGADFAEKLAATMRPLLGAR